MHYRRNDKIDRKARKKMSAATGWPSEKKTILEI